MYKTFPQTKKQKMEKKIDGKIKNWNEIVDEGKGEKYHCLTHLTAGALDLRKGRLSKRV